MLCRKIRFLLHSHGLCKVAFPVELLARECLNNALIHGNRNEADKSITVRLSLGREWIRLEVRDEGRGFGWRKAWQNRLDTAATASCGRGLQLCALYAGRVRFNRCGNQITLWISKQNRIGEEDGDGCICD